VRFSQVLNTERRVGRERTGERKRGEERRGQDTWGYAALLKGARSMTCATRWKQGMCG
jgi:hypothetical protein